MKRIRILQLPHSAGSHLFRGNGRIIGFRKGFFLLKLNSKFVVTRRGEVSTSYSARGSIGEEAASYSAAAATGH